MMLLKREMGSGTVTIGAWGSSLLAFLGSPVSELPKPRTCLNAGSLSRRQHVEAREITFKPRAPLATRVWGLVVGFRLSPHVPAFDHSKSAAHCEETT